jgi:hypothetical protein
MIGQYLFWSKRSLRCLAALGRVAHRHTDRKEIAITRVKKVG